MESSNSDVFHVSHSNENGAHSPSRSQRSASRRSESSASSDRAPVSEFHATQSPKPSTLATPKTPVQPDRPDFDSAKRGRRRKPIPETVIPYADLSPQSAWRMWYAATPFIVIHLCVLGALWTGVRWTDVAICALLFVVRMFAVTGFYHRYFSHRTFKTSRVFQTIMALTAMTSSQKGVIWWAAHHRHHHKHSDTETDVHSPRHRGFLYSHCGWVFDKKGYTDYSRAKDLAQFPELVWLDRFWFIPPTALGVAVWFFFGWSALWIGFMLSTVLLWHATYTINSIAHLIGRQRFKTTDDSRNNFLLALLTLGEGWHNNHHHYMTSTRQGFYWWEIDLTYYGLKCLSWLGLIWNLREVPPAILEEGRRRAA